MQITEWDSNINSPIKRYKRLDKAQIDLALSYMQEFQISIRKTAEVFDIPKSTLHREVQKRSQTQKEANLAPDQELLIQQLEKLSENLM
ncbi:DNA_binding HTH domain [Hexamita inflata]|uniref:Psq-type n=1 Tax=Hexamita inflata TaxID=28002 RepID=A0AA86NFZ5_9EUKA|nr:DNA binding HTH domain [Hexamita inflata]CAI9942747.1 DNA binding HTH domain [Hexamita inflata]